MKKRIKIALLLAALVFLLSASVWEGAAAVSFDFPESGLYVATNSFPRNTIIDLTNLETGKTIRVIVASGLDTPGLLALVSREAAEAIGLRPRTIGRIRMIAPQDPIAYSRFSDDTFLSGDPDFNPVAAVEGIYGNGSAAPAETPPVVAPPVSVTEPAADDNKPNGSGTPVRSEPDSYWDDTPVVSTPIEDGPVVSGIRDDTVNVAIIDEPFLPEDTFFVEEDFPVISDAIALAPAADPVLTRPISEDMPVYIPPAVEPPVTTPPPTERPVTTSPSSVPEYNYTLIPAEERPPQSIPGSPSGNATVPPITTVPQIFSAPAVYELERGKYYLQLGAFSNVPAVEQELKKIERGYPVTVQCINLSGKPAYRILIGPVNQGEAGALLKKFQARGYKDAFVRKE